MAKELEQSDAERLGIPLIDQHGRHFFLTVRELAEMIVNEISDAVERREKGQDKEKTDE